MQWQKGIPLPYKRWMPPYRKPAPAGPKPSVFQTTVFAQQMANCYSKAQQIVDALHGYQGTFGGLFFVAKVDVDWLFHTYDNDSKLHQIVLDSTLDIPS